MTVVLASSDARQRYAHDILSVAAAPIGTHFQFRYETAYVSSDLQALIASGRALGAAALVAFVGQVNTPDAFILPVRHVQISSAEIIAEALIVRFVLAGYPDLTSWPRDAATLQNHGKSVLNQISARYGKYFPAVGASDGLICHDNGNSTESWSEISSRLSTFSTFASSYLVRVSVVENRKDVKKEVSTTDGQIEVSSGSGIIVKCWFYTRTQPAGGRIISVSTDDRILHVSSDSAHELSSRYDEVEFWLHGRSVAERSRTMLTVALPGDSTRTGDLPTRVTFPVIVGKPLLPRVYRGFAGATGAAFVGLPALLGAESPLLPRVALAVVGAIIIAFLAVFSA